MFYIALVGIFALFILKNNTIEVLSLSLSDLNNFNSSFSQRLTTFIRLFKSQKYCQSCTEYLQCVPSNYLGNISVTKVSISKERLRHLWCMNHRQKIWTWRVWHPFVPKKAISYVRRSMGLIWTPVSCNPLQTVAIIVPYRDREANLTIFLNHMHPFLRRQLIAYTIFVIEQLSPSLFNRGALLNVGFIEAFKLYTYDCFIFHDVDLLPQHSRNPYLCGDSPLHLSVAIDKFNYKLPYRQIFGGAVAMRPSHFVAVGGYSNAYYGWGGEDDEMYKRIIYAGHRPARRSEMLSIYTMLSHGREANNEPNYRRFELLKTVLERYKTDTFLTTKYSIKEAELCLCGLFYRFAAYLPKLFA